MTKPTISVTKLYEQSLVERGYKADAAQLKGIAALQRCQDEWSVYKGQRSNALTKMLRYPVLPKGVYMYGGVGRGKSFLMDCFFRSVPLTRSTQGGTEVWLSGAAPSEGASGCATSCSRLRQAPHVLACGSGLNPERSSLTAASAGLRRPCHRPSGPTPSSRVVDWCAISKGSGPAL